MNNEIRVVSIVVIVFVLIFGLIFGLLTLADYQEMKAYNRIKGTDHNFADWFWAESTIRDYHDGTVSNINLNIKGGTN